MRSTMKRNVFLKLDHDPYAPRLPLKELVKRARKANLTLRALAERRSPSGKGWHRWLLVSPAPRSRAEVVALQLLFGGDPYREAWLLNRARAIDAGRVRGYWAQHDNWNVLYVPATVAGRQAAGANRRTSGGTGNA